MLLGFIQKWQIENDFCLCRSYAKLVFNSVHIAVLLVLFHSLFTILLNIQIQQNSRIAKTMKNIYVKMLSVSKSYL